MNAVRIENSPRSITGALVACAVTGGLLAGAGLGGAPRANATCASFFGIGNSADCTSTLFSIAVALGDGASARADGVPTPAGIEVVQWDCQVGELVGRCQDRWS